MSNKKIILLAMTVTFVIVAPPALVGWLFPFITTGTLQGWSIVVAAAYSFVSAFVAVIVTDALA
jgi:hypothetical protein